MKEQVQTERCKPNAKNRLLDAGVRLFLSSENESITTRMIAKEAQANHALIAYHYGSVTQLMEAVVEKCLEDLREQIVPDLEAFQEVMKEADTATLATQFEQSFIKVINALQGEKSAALLQALTSPDARLVKDAYLRFTNTITQPLFKAFVDFVAKAQKRSKTELEVAVLAQLLMSQSMAFFRGGSLVKKHLGLADVDAFGLSTDASGEKHLTETQQSNITNIIVKSMLRTVGL